jgi:hypothetical protein
MAFRRMPQASATGQVRYGRRPRDRGPVGRCSRANLTRLRLHAGDGARDRGRGAQQLQLASEVHVERSRGLAFGGNWHPHASFSPQQWGYLDSRQPATHTVVCRSVPYARARRESADHCGLLGRKFSRQRSMGVSIAWAHNREGIVTRHRRAAHGRPSEAGCAARKEHR